MTTRTTRRGILAGAAALPIAAIADAMHTSPAEALPAASPISDPVFAAIEQGVCN